MVAVVKTALACALALLTPALASAQSGQSGDHLSFSAYAAGFNVIDLGADIDLSGRGYRIDLSFRTVGTLGALVDARIESIAAGLWTTNAVQPARFYSYGTVRGRPRRTQIDYAGGQPELRILEPAADEEREPISPGLEHDTIDTLSAMALLVHQVQTTGRCDGGTRTFDGRRLSAITVHTAGTETLPSTGRSTFAGPALRCDFEGRQLGGFIRDADRAELERPQHGSAWLAPVTPGGPPLPVRLSFHTRFFGDATMYLTGVRPVSQRTN